MLRLVTALAAEARPLIDHYGLKPHPSSAPYSVHGNDRIQLIVSDIGTANAIAATAFLQGLTQTAGPGPWLNVGICGHRDHAVGTPLLAHAITDAVSGQSQYPTIPFKPPCATAPVTTVRRPVTDYPDAQAYEMEAAGFWPTARRLAPLELVHCLKIVSDTPAHPIAQITPQKITALCATHLPLVDTLLKTLEALCPLTGDPPLYAQCQNRWHFTATQQHQLRRRLCDLHTLNVDLPSQWPALEKLHRGRDVLAFLHQIHTNLPPPDYT